MSFFNRIEASNCMKLPERNYTNEHIDFRHKRIRIPFGKWKVIGHDEIDFTTTWAIKYLQWRSNLDERSAKKQLEHQDKIEIPHHELGSNCNNFLFAGRDVISVPMQDYYYKKESTNNQNSERYSFEYRFIHYPLQALIVRHILDQTNGFESIENILRPFEWDQNKNAYSNPELHNQVMSKYKKQSVIDAMAYCRHFFSLNTRRYVENKDKSIFSVLSLLASQAKQENLMNEFLTLVCDLSTYDFFKNVTNELFNTIPDEEEAWKPFIDCFVNSNQLKLLFGDRIDLLEELVMVFAKKYYAKTQLTHSITLFENFLETLSIAGFFKFIKIAAESCLPENVSKLVFKSEILSSIDYFKMLLMTGLNIKLCLDKMLPEFNKYVTQITFLFYEGLTRLDRDVVDKLQQIANANEINKKEVKRKRPKTNSQFFYNNNTLMSEDFDLRPDKNNHSKYVEKSSEVIRTEKIEFTQTVPFNEIDLFEYMIQKYNHTPEQERDRLFFVQYKDVFIQTLQDRQLISIDHSIIIQNMNRFRGSDSMKEDNQGQNSSQVQELINKVDVLTKQNIFLMNQCQENTEHIKQLLQIVMQQAQKQKELENQLSAMCNLSNSMHC